MLLVACNRKIKAKDMLDQFWFLVFLAVNLIKLTVCFTVLPTLLQSCRRYLDL